MQFYYKKSVKTIYCMKTVKKLIRESKAKQQDKARVKKMGGGMMQRPMGMGMAKKGKMIKARGGGLARTKPTSMY